MTLKALLSVGRSFPLLAIAAIGWQPLAAQKHIGSSGPYLHREAAAVFPARVGEFRRSELLRYDDAARDVSASYNLRTPKGRLLVTVYIYPAAPAGQTSETSKTALCNGEFESVKSAIERQHGGDPVEIPALALPGTHGALRHRAAYLLGIKFDGRVRDVRSEAHLYCYVGGDWFVKYRVTAPAKVSADAAVETFIRTGPWPGRFSPETVARLDPPPGRGTPLPTQR